MTSAEHHAAAALLLGLIDGGTLFHGDTIRLAELAAWHEAEAEAAALRLRSPECLCPGGMCNVCREREDGHPAANTPGDDAITS